jgi:5-(carboxyamino)imidazole ribonucleotide mutase
LKDIKTLFFMTPTVAIIMGSKSDLKIMQDAADILKQFGVAYDLSVVSAHRTPERMRTYAMEAKSRGIKVIIAGA